MPSYTVYHAQPLTEDQQQQIASGITEIHSTIFSSLTALVNVDFADVSARKVYIAGAPRKVPSTIHGGLRSGHTRTRAMYEQLCHDLIAMWDKIVRDGNTGLGEDELRVFLTGSLLAAVEGGFLIPEAGSDGHWFKDNKAEIEKRAAAGQYISQVMLRDIEVLGETAVA